MQNNGILNGISWTDIKDLIKAAKYLGCGNVFDALAKLLMCLIRGDQFQIRRTFSFEPIVFHFNEDDWEHDPMDSLDSDNFIFNLFPLEIIIDIVTRLPKNKKKTFLHAFGQNSSTFRILFNCRQTWDSDAFPINKELFIYMNQNFLCLLFISSYYFFFFSC